MPNELNHEIRFKYAITLASKYPSSIFTSILTFRKWNCLIFPYLWKRHRYIFTSFLRRKNKWGNQFWGVWAEWCNHKWHVKCYGWKQDKTTFPTQICSLSLIYNQLLDFKVSFLSIFTVFIFMMHIGIIHLVRTENFPKN